MKGFWFFVAAYSVFASASHGTGILEGLVTGLEQPEDAVVYLEGVEDSRERASDVVAKVDQIDRTYVPFVTAIPVGAVVEFHNSEDEVHNVHAKMGKKTLFNIGMPPLGQPVPQRFKEAGEVRLECDRHMTMDAWIKVLPHRYFVRPDEDGRFRLEGVPSGRHLAVAWHPYADEPARARVDIPVDGLVHVELAFGVEE